jgi:hypothetical protein
MTKKLSLVALVLVVACAVAFAGDTKMGMAGKPTMDAMQAAMMKCATCKPIAARMNEIGPVGMSSVKLNDGFAHSISVKSENPKALAAFQTACAEMNTAGEACMKMTDEQAKTDLCEFCQGIRSAMHAGAKMSMGMTKNSSMMVMTSADPAVQAKLAALHEKCEMMASMMDQPTGKMAADGK